MKSFKEQEHQINLNNALPSHDVIQAVTEEKPKRLNFVSPTNKDQPIKMFGVIDYVYCIVSLNNKPNAN